MRMKVSNVLFVCLSFSAVASAQTQDKVALVDQIIAAQAAFEEALQQAAGSVVVRKTLAVKEDPAVSAAVERASPGKMEKMRNYVRESNSTYSVDFAVKNGLQRVTAYEYDQTAARRGAVTEDRISLADSFWRYVPGENRAYHASPDISVMGLASDFRLGAFNSLDSVSPAVLLRNSLGGAQYWDSSTRPDGMLVIKCGAEAQSNGSPKWDVVCVLNPAAGYCVVEFGQTSDWGNGNVRKVAYAVDWDRKANVWVPKKASYTVDWKKPADERTGFGDSVQTCQLDFGSFDPEASIDDSLFTVEKLNMAPGTKVNDVVAGVVYRYKSTVDTSDLPAGISEGLISSSALPGASEESTAAATDSVPVIPPSQPSGGEGASGRVTCLVIAAILVLLAAAFLLRRAARTKR